MKQIKKIISKYRIPTSEIVNYGEYIAKIKSIDKTPNNNKLVLVTAISPTPAGEGKTTISIALADALNKLGHKTIATLREPSLGPVFGAKGGANGGGKSQIIPKQEIDMHLTGDFHAITSANNLISACIDNEIYWNSDLKIDINKIIWKRVMDMNDRSLRDVTVVIDAERELKYKTGFDITAASEIMAIFCLSKTPEMFKEKIGKIIVAYSKRNKPIYLRDLNITNAIMKLMENAFLPNAVQTLEGNLALVHGGPFANIAHGCNSLISINTAMSYAKYTVCEAGFGSDLGGEKFFNIVCPENGIYPHAVVLVATIRSIKYHGGMEYANIDKPDIKFLKKGLEHLEHHIKNLKNYGVPVTIALNNFPTDTKEEIDILFNESRKWATKISVVTAFADGSSGAIDLAKNVVINCAKKIKPKSLYKVTDSFETKINTIVRKSYGGLGVEYTKEAKEQLKKFKDKNAYVCVAKTPLSFSDDPKKIVIDKAFKIKIREIVLANGANFLIAIAGQSFRMPGLPRIPEAKKM